MIRMMLNVYIKTLNILQELENKEYKTEHLGFSYQSQHLSLKLHLTEDNYIEHHFNNSKNFGIIVKFGAVNNILLFDLIVWALYMGILFVTYLEI